MANEPPGQMRIGSVLAEARARAGLDLRTVEAETKIRVKYLQALEDEEWEVLPSPAYAKGFLRTYAQRLGLDGEALVDEYRRQVESKLGGPSYPLGDQVLESRRRRSAREPGPRIGILLAGVALAVLATLFAIGFFGDDESGDGGRRADARGHEQRDDRRSGGGGDRRAAAGPVALSLLVREPVEICLVGGGGKALIDGQVLAPGTEEAYERREFELRFPSGFSPAQFRLEIAGKGRRLPKVNGPAAFEIVAPKRVRAVEPPRGEDCP